ncbi:TIGR02186 family protein [Croceicoccus mobilis]|nr:TIGR02186 family protein [Croceicoccus mobilis]
MRLVRLLMACALMAGLAPAAHAQPRDPILVPEISQHEVIVRQGFTGADLLLYGAILQPDGRARPGTSPYDIVVVLKGPSEAINLREKRRIWGMWINADSAQFRSAPSYYAVASSRPLSDIVDPRTAAIYELGVNYLQLSPIGAIRPEEVSRFAEGLVAKREASGLYSQQEDAVSISEGVLYQARIALPSSVLTGTYTAETFAIANGRVLASATSEVTVSKKGFERAVEVASRQWSLAYGLMAVALSVFMGWAAGRLFALG